MDRVRTDEDAGTGPEISVLVPIYNVERYLGQCLESIQCQTFADFEVICINDGSTDGSRDVIERFLSDARFRVIDKPNSGYGASMNRGLDEARGRYLAIVESDDFLDPEAFETLYAIAQRSGAEVVKANFFFFWSSPPRDELFAFVAPSMVGNDVDPLDDPRVFYGKPSIWSALYRIDFLRENGIRFLETPGASYQDAGFAFKVWVCARHAAFTEQAFLHYRQDNESSSVNSPGKMYCVCDEYAEMERFLATRPELVARLRPVLLKMKYDTYMWNFERLSPQLQPEFLERVAQEFSAHLAAGELDLALFEPWKVEDMKRIVADPTGYAARRAMFAKWGRAGKALHYLTMGGPAMMLQIARRKHEAAQ